MDSAKTTRTAPTRSGNRRRLAIILLTTSLVLIAVLPMAGPLYRRTGPSRFASLRKGMTIDEAFSVLMPGEVPFWRSSPGTEKFAPHGAGFAYYEEQWLPAFFANLTFDDEGRLEEKQLETPTYRKTMYYWWSNVLAFFRLV